VDASENADIEALPVDEKYKGLLRLSVKLTENAYKVMDEDIDALRSLGLSDDEVLEGVFVACQFNAIDRLADTFGLYELMQLREHQTPQSDGG
jgi:alkylhydroperoxidase family enzyme